jgi:hypothetical protein
MSETKVYEVPAELRDNWLALFEELASCENPMQLWAWANGEMSLIEQSIDELKSLEEVYSPPVLVICANPDCGWMGDLKFCVILAPSQRPFCPQCNEVVEFLGWSE